jgi:hypothetical protein
VTVIYECGGLEVVRCEANLVGQSSPGIEAGQSDGLRNSLAPLAHTSANASLAYAEVSRRSSLLLPLLQDTGLV